jgi:ERCC4-related helicase
MASQQHELEGAVQMSPLTSKLAEQHLTSRAYQLEMFEQSLKQNIIVCMETGSGKTHVYARPPPPTTF